MILASENVWKGSLANLQLAYFSREWFSEVVGIGGGKSRLGLSVLLNRSGAILDLIDLGKLKM